VLKAHNLLTWSKALLVGGTLAKGSSADSRVLRALGDLRRNRAGVSSVLFAAYITHAIKLGSVAIWTSALAFEKASVSNRSHPWHYFPCARSKTGP